LRTSDTVLGSAPVRRDPEHLARHPETETVMPSVTDAFVETAKSYPGAARTILNPNTYVDHCHGAKMQGKSQVKAAGEVFAAQMAVLIAPIALLKGTYQKYKMAKNEEHTKHLVAQGADLLGSWGLSRDGAVAVATEIIRGWTPDRPLDPADQSVRDRMEQVAPKLFTRGGFTEYLENL
jgi:hypothetical protein